MPNGSMIFHGSTILLTSSTLNYGDKIRLRSDFDGQMAGLRWQHRAGCSWHMPALNVHEPVDRWHQLRQSLRLQVKAATDMVQVDGPHGVFWRFLKGGGSTTSYRYRPPPQWEQQKSLNLKEFGFPVVTISRCFWMNWSARIGGR